MKELIRSNVAIEQFSNGVLLTTRPFPPTLGREGEIFMPEPGNGDIPAGNVSKEPRVPRPEPGKHLTPEQESVIMGRWERDYLKGRDISSLPFDERQTVETAMKAGFVPGGGGIGEREQPTEPGAAGAPPPPPPPEAPPTTPAGEEPEEGQPQRERPPIDTARVSDERLRQIFDRYSRRLARGLIDFEEIDRTIRDIEQVKVDPALSEDDWIWADTTIEQLEQRMVDARAATRSEAEERRGEPRSQQEAVLNRITAIGSRDTTSEEEEKEKEKDIINELRILSPSGESLASELIDSVIDYENALEYLINRIISEPLDAETTRYQLGFHGGINFSLIRERLRVSFEALRRGKDIDGALKKEGLHRKFELMRSAAETVHNTNWKIVTGELQQSIEVGRDVTTEHLQVLQRVKLASTVKRLYDQELQRVFARDGKTTSENYAEITGAIFDEGDVVGKIQGTIEKQLLAINNSLPAADKLDDWQLKWAFYAGRDLLNIEFRAAELIARSPGRAIGFRSFPQESAARLIDPIDVTGDRFIIAEQRGGIAFSEMAKANFHRDRILYGWKDSNMETINGINREIFEASGMLDITGVWSSWRQTDILSIRDPDNPDATRYLSIGEFLGKNRLDRYINYKDNPEILTKVFLENGELKTGFTHSLGALLKLGPLTPTENDSPALIEAKREVRTAIWKRVALDNPLAMVNLLYGMRFKSGKEPVANANSRLGSLETRMYSTGAEGKKDTEAWESLRNKLTIAHEGRMRRISEGEIVGTEDLLDVNALPDGEKVIFDEIRNLGRDVAGELAEIRFPSNPFMNDVLYEKARYGKAGEEFFKRRLGDLVSMFGAGQGFTKLMDNPGGTPTEEALKALQDAVKALESPQGTESGQNNIAPINEAYLNFIYGGGPTSQGKKTLGERFLEPADFLFNRSLLVNGVKHLIRTPTSLAQRYAGPSAASHTINEMRDLLDQELKMGIIRKGGISGAGVPWSDLYERFRRKFKLAPGWLVLAFFRDVIPLFVGGALVDFGQKTAKEKT